MANLEQTGAKTIAFSNPIYDLDYEMEHQNQILKSSSPQSSQMNRPIPKPRKSKMNKSTLQSQPMKNDSDLQKSVKKTEINTDNNQSEEERMERLLQEINSLTNTLANDLNSISVANHPKSPSPPSSVEVKSAFKESSSDDDVEASSSKSKSNSSHNSKKVIPVESELLEDSFFTKDFNQIFDYFDMNNNRNELEQYRSCDSLISELSAAEDVAETDLDFEERNLNEKNDYPPELPPKNLILDGNFYMQKTKIIIFFLIIFVF